jgi:CheY-like chemotaxis protein
MAIAAKAQSEPPAMSVLLLTDDLFTSSRVEGAAQRIAIRVKTVSDCASAISACHDQHVDVLLVDLSARAGDVASIREQFAKLAVDPPPLVAFGPHVHDQLLAAAADAGCDEVVSRGQFFAQLATILTRFVGPARRDQEAPPGS